MAETLKLKEFDENCWFLGYFNEEKRDGFGQEFKKPTDEKIHGVWKDGKLDGSALIINNEVIYIGEIQDGKKSGFAKIKKLTGDNKEISGLVKFDNDQLVEEIEDPSGKIFSDLYTNLKNASLDFELNIEASKMTSLFDWYSLLHQFGPKDEPKKKQKREKVATSNNGNSNKSKKSSKGKKKKEITLSPNKKIPEVVKKDVKNFSPEYRAIDLKGSIEPETNKQRNKRSKIYLSTGDKIIPYLENVKKLHKNKVLIKGKVVHLPEPNMNENNPKTDFDDRELLFRNQLSGEPGLEEYKDILERDKRIQVYYKSYLDRMMKERPKDWVERIGKRKKYKGRKRNPNDPDPIPDLWDEFLGKYYSGKVYMPGVRPQKEIDEMTEEEKKLYLFNTDYKPPFEKYVTSKRNSPSKQDDGNNHILIYFLEKEVDSKRVTFGSDSLVHKYTSERNPDQFEEQKKEIRGAQEEKYKQKLRKLDRYAFPEDLLEDNRSSSKYSYLRSVTPNNMKRNWNRHRGKKNQNRSYSPLTGKKTKDVMKRWGDYSRVAYLMERARLEQMPICHKFFDPIEHKKANRLEEWAKRVEPYSYHSTKKYFDPRPEKNFLSKRNNDKKFSKMFPEERKTPESEIIKKKKSLKYSGKIKQRKSGKRRQMDNQEIGKYHLTIGEAKIPVKVRSIKTKKSVKKKNSGGKRFNASKKSKKGNSSKSRSRSRNTVEVTNFDEKVNKAHSPYHNRYQQLNQSKVSRGKGKSKSRSKR